MSPPQLVFMLFLALPFFAAAISPAGRSPWLAPGAVASLLRLLLLVLMARWVLPGAGELSLRIPLVPGYPIELPLQVNVFRVGFLLVAESCFLLAHWLIPWGVAGAMLVRSLVSLAQGLCTLVFLSDNTAAVGAGLMAAGAVHFHLIRVSSGEGLALGDDAVSTRAISARVHVLFFLLSIFCLCWGVLEFSGASLVFGRASGAVPGMFLWAALVVLSIPIAPWSGWFAQSLDRLPEGVSLAVVIFLSALALKWTMLLGLAYPGFPVPGKLALFLLGMLGCVISLAAVFAAEDRRRMLASVPSFFLSSILVSIGVAGELAPQSVYYAAIFIPVQTALAHAISAMRLEERSRLPLTALLLLLVAGVPGTPVYQLFSTIGGRAIALGSAYALSFGVLWLFYFNSSLYICRRLFLDAEPAGYGAPVVQPGQGAAFLSGYLLFLMFLVVAVSQAAGRLL